MPKFIGFVFLAVLIGSSVVAWSRSTATGSLEANHANRLRAFAPDEMHKTAAVRSLPPQKINDMSVVFSEEP
jgi:hypothetical protein